MWLEEVLGVDDATLAAFDKFKVDGETLLELEEKDLERDLHLRDKGVRVHIATSIKALNDRAAEQAAAARSKRNAKRIKEAIAGGDVHRYGSCV